LRIFHSSILLLFYYFWIAKSFFVFFDLFLSFSFIFWFHFLFFGERFSVPLLFNRILGFCCGRSNLRVFALST